MPAGRPTKYSTENLEFVSKLYKIGLIDWQVAEILDVTRECLYDWQKAHPEFVYTVKNAKETANETVKASLFHRAIGYDHPETELKVVSKGNNEGSEVVPVEVVKHYAPDTMAAMYWLNNREPRDWKTRTSQENVTPEKLKKFISAVGSLVSEFVLEDKKGDCLKKIDELIYKYDNE